MENNKNVQEQFEVADKGLANNLIEELKKGVVTFTYKKINGEERFAKGTLNKSFSKELAEYVAKGTKTPSDDVITYWDLDKNGWRTLKKENLISYMTIEY